MFGWRGKGDCGQETPFTLRGITTSSYKGIFSFRGKITLPLVRDQPESCCLDGKGYAIEYKVLLLRQFGVPEYKLEIQQVKIDFSYLVGKHAWELEPDVTEKYKSNQKGRGRTRRGSRALTNHEKEYMNLLMFAKTFAENPRASIDHEEGSMSPRTPEEQDFSEEEYFSRPF